MTTTFLFGRDRVMIKYRIKKNRGVGSRFSVQRNRDGRWVTVAGNMSYPEAKRYVANWIESDDRNKRIAAREREIIARREKLTVLAPRITAVKERLWCLRELRGAPCFARDIREIEAEMAELQEEMRAIDIEAGMRINWHERPRWWE